MTNPAASPAPPETQTPAVRLAFGKRLLAWYTRNRRELPWRRSHDPYHVWLSEIMLQQTRVAAVLGHYERFLERFPTVQKLAAAGEASVLAAWSGLGYYRRARMLHAAAKKIVRELGGSIPSTSAGLRNLPGIGRYTSAAIASIAFNEPVPVVDGNVERVLQRIAGTRLSERELWQNAAAWLSRSRPGDFNQAMMELGATLCLPGEPLCQACPVAQFCRTRGRGPLPKAKVRQRKRKVFYALNCRNGSVLMVKRPPGSSLMPNMWELPEISPQTAEPEMNLKHSITVTDYSVHVMRNGTARAEGRWVPKSQLALLPLTGLARKILRKAELI